MDLSCDVLVGLQHGDEGKGKLTKYFAETGNYNYCVRFNGGPNAGHTIYFNGKMIHDNVKIKKVWGGPFSGLDGGNNNGYGITPSPGGIKLQSESHEVLYRNIWIEELELENNDTSF